MSIAQTVNQLENFSEEIILVVLDPFVPEIGNLSFTSVSVTTTPSFPSDGVVPIPANVTLTDTSNVNKLSVLISGDYGLGIAVEDFYRTVTYFDDYSFEFTTYNNVNELIQDDYLHLVDYLPQDWSYKTYEYTFSVTVNGVTSNSTITQDVYANTDRHVPTVTNLISREAII